MSNTTVAPTTLQPTSYPTPTPTQAPIFGRLVGWTVQLLYMFLLYFGVAVFLFLIFLYGRYRAIKAHKNNTTNRELDEKDQLLLNESESENESFTDSTNFGFTLDPNKKKDDWIDMDMPVPSFTKTGDNTLLGFIPTLIKMDDNKIRSLSGLDGFVYLKFMKYLIVLLFFLSLISAGLIPIYHFSGITEPPFSRITAMNIKPGDPKNYITAFSVFLNTTLVLIFLLVVWKLYKQHLRTHSTELDLRRFTIMISNFPQEVVDENLVSEYFNSLNEGCVEKVVINIDCSYLKKYQTNANHLIEKLHHLKALKKLTLNGRRASCHFRKDVVKLDKQIHDVEQEMLTLGEKIKKWNLKKKREHWELFCDIQITAALPRYHQRSEKQRV
eukprot:TRINITY_DN1824_c0_g1_i1.p1 TRINITY_DN1824_c0_g1~~TRINITY_DN1824_c0_g1_i1.p1  ORF type:complete len:384 (+),score=85.21 TRINITY_DN1824_c0_g1_i1:91-1242(+)